MLSRKLANSRVRIVYYTQVDRPLLLTSCERLSRHIFRNVSKAPGAVGGGIRGVNSLGDAGPESRPV